MSSNRKMQKSDLSKRQLSGTSTQSVADKAVASRSKTPLLRQVPGSTPKFSLIRFILAKVKTSVSWVIYMLVSLAIGLVILLSISTVSLLWHIREEASEDYQAPECGPAMTTHTLSTIGFASCNKHDLPQSFWPTVKDILRSESLLTEKHIPSTPEAQTCQRESLPSARASVLRPSDAFVWLGDVVYLDGTAGIGTNVTTATEIAYSGMDVAIKGYEGNSNPHYKEFKSILKNNNDNNDNRDKGLEIVAEAGREPTSRIIGTWDDHDMGINDGGKEFKFHKHTQGRFLDFLEVNSDDLLRDREGTYSFHSITAPTATVDGFNLAQRFDNAFCIILMDARTHRDSIDLSRQGDMLGEAQWQWLEHILKTRVSDLGQADPTAKKKCAATIIGSGIQFLSSEKPTEQWWNFEGNQRRLWFLLTKYQVSRTAFISGDIHLMELVKSDAAYSTLGYPLIDFTSSGLTHHSGKFFDVFTSFRWALAKLFPMAVACKSRGLTPIGDQTSRKCSSAFSLLPDWLYESIFPAFDWRLGHYLGRNLGAISLQVSIPQSGEPQLALRFAGFALSLEERDDFVPYRFENEPRGGSSISKAVSVTRHDATYQVLEYVQPLSELEFKPDTQVLATQRHTAIKTIIFACQNLAVSMSNNRYNRNIGVIIGLAVFVIPIGMAFLWIGSLIVRHCKGGDKRKKSKTLVKAK